MAGLHDSDGGIPSLTTPSLSSAIGGSSNKELMADARASLSGNWGMAVLGYFLYILFTESLGFFLQAALTFVSAIASLSGANSIGPYYAVFSLGYLLFFIVLGPIAVGFNAFFLEIAQEDNTKLERLFFGFKRFWSSVGCYFFYGLFVFLWHLLLVVPGIIKSFSYAMAPYIIADDEDCGPLEAISRSKEMMKGNKWKYFCLHWRFFGWGLLAMLFTFGIGFLWLVPYMQTSMAKFYEDVK